MPMGGIEGPGMAMKGLSLSSSKPLSSSSGRVKVSTNGVGGGIAQVGHSFLLIMPFSLHTVIK